MSTTYQVSRTRCSGRAPPSARMALMLASVWRTCATKPSARRSSASQPITRPVTTMPPAAMPLAQHFGIGQPLGCSTCVPSPFADGTTARVGPFVVVTKTSPFDLFGGDAGRRARLRHLPEREATQLAGLGLGQLRDEF